MIGNAEGVPDAISYQPSAVSQTFLPSLDETE